MRSTSVNITSIFSVICILSIAGSAIPSLTITGDQTTDIGSTSKFNLNLSEAPDGLSGYNITVSLTDASIAKIISIEFPAWASLKSNSSLPGDSVWLKAVDLNNQTVPGATNVILVTLVVRRDNPGNINFSITVGQMDDDNGSAINTNAAPGQAGTTVAVSPISTTAAISTTKPEQTSTSTPVSTLAQTSKPTDTPSQKEIPKTQKRTPGFQIVLAILGVFVALRYRKQ